MSDNEPQVPTEDQIKAALIARPEVQEYLSKYNPTSVERFLKTYAWNIQFSLKYGPGTEEQLKQRSLEFLDDAEKCMWEIQHKKLFDMQCLWRAEKLEVPGAESIYDFCYWADYIESCPWLTPITQDEIDFYIQFLNSGHRDDVPWWPDYQDYECFRDEVQNPEEGSTYPEYYEYYDLMHGNHGILTLPDIRGPKEDHYHRIALKQQRDEAEAQMESQPREPVDPRPRIEDDNEEMLKFAQQFEDAPTQKYLRIMMKKREENYDYDMVTEAFYYLQGINEYISFEPHYDWREQMILTVAHYKNRKLAEALPLAYASYRMRIDTGIGYPHRIEWTTSTTGEKIDKSGFWLDAKKRVLEGRRLLGEPMDWNF